MGLAFEEICVQQMTVRLTIWRSKRQQNCEGRDNDDVPCRWKQSPFIATAVRHLLFAFTPSQQSILDEIYPDSRGDDCRMSRLLQGDVGSGKTVLAYLVGWGCMESTGGRVVAMLTPTTLLAEQRRQTMGSFAKRWNEGIRRRKDEGGLYQG